MALMTQYASFYVSPFGERSVTDELNAFLRSRRRFSASLEEGAGQGWPKTNNR